MRENRTSNLKIFIFLGTMVLLGTFMGTLSSRVLNSSILEGLSSAGSEFIGYRRSADYGRIFACSLGSCSVFLAVIFLCGISPMGQLFAALILFFRGIGLGAVISRIYISRSMVLNSCVLFVPGTVVATLTLIFSAVEAIRLANVYLTVTFSGKNEQGLLEDFKLYTAKFLVFESMLALSAGVDCLCSFLVKTYFHG